MKEATKISIAMHIKHWFTVSTILWTLYIAYSLLFHANETATPLFNEVVDLGMPILKLWFFLYILPRYAYKGLLLLLSSYKRLIVS